MSATNILTRISNLLGGRAAGAAAAGAGAGGTASRSVARERLSVILASQRGSQLLEGVDMDLFQRDVMEIVRKHIKLASDRPASFQVKQEGDVNLFEMQVEIADGANRRRSASVSLSASAPSSSSAAAVETASSQQRSTL